MAWIIDVDAGTATEDELGLVVTFTPDPDQLGAWDGTTGPGQVQKLFRVLVDRLGADEAAAALPRLLREAGDAFRAAIA